MATVAATFGLTAAPRSQNVPSTSSRELSGSTFASGSAMRKGFATGGESFNRLALKARFVPEPARQAVKPLVVEANLFNRVVRVVQSYANAVVSAAEDPEKLLEQTVNEMNDDLIKLRQASAQVMASQKQLESKMMQAQATSDDWYRRAQLALQKGDEELAREALVRRKGFQDNADSLRGQFETQKSSVEKLIANTRVLEQKISEAKAKKDTLKARAASAKTSQKVNEMVGNLSTSSALAAFDRMEEKVIQMEAEADSVAALTSDELSNKFAMLEAGSVDDELSSLKKQMLGEGPKQVGALPPGKEVPRSSAIEDELEQLRKKTKEL